MGERGQGAAEYVGVLALVGLVVGALALTGVGGRVGETFEGAVCRVVRDPGCANPEEAAGEERAPAWVRVGFAAPLREDPRDELAEELEGLRDDPPEAVAAFFAGRDQEWRARLAALIEERPELVADLDGAPSNVRFVANRALVARHIEDLQRRREEHLRRFPWLREDLPGPWDGLARARDRFHEARHWWPYDRELDQRLGLPEGDLSRRQELLLLEQRIARYQRWVYEGRNLLLFDPSGDGRAVEVFGPPPEEADHVAVVVPGVWNELTNYDFFFRPQALNLHGAANAEGREQPVTTVAWLGYDAPDAALRPTAMRVRAARQGGEALEEYLRGLDATRRGRVTVVGHSYGSVVVAEGIDGQDTMDDVVFIGSPGVRRQHVSQLDTSARVWVGRTRSDEINAVVDFDVGPLGHARDPWDPAFGATRFDVGRSARGHLGYFTDDAALAAIGRIVVGRGEPM